MSQTLNLTQHVVINLKFLGDAENVVVENAGVEKAGVDTRDGKCRSGKCRSR